MSKSGGTTARNPREGFRSEYIAEYVFSAFGTAVPVIQGNDIGIDIICNLTNFVGHLIYFESSYGVQVKSKDTAFEFNGTQATAWLSKLEYPLLLAEVDKAEGLIKIYSTWNLNRYLLALHSESENTFPAQIKFELGNDPSIDLKEPDPSTGNIPVGVPILEIRIQDLGKDENRANYLKILSEWLKIDNENYVNRRAGLPMVFGYTRWKTNTPLANDYRIWYRPYYYSAFHETKAKKLIANAFVALGIYHKAICSQSGSEESRNEFNALQRYASNYLTNQMNDEGKNLFKIEL
jgi:hypothetical protein